jgi:CelD/BcsL family acetyltransferase involved in cellulose biosynthesis
MDNDRWEAKEVTLKYKLGEFTVRAVNLPFLVLDRHFSQLGTDIGKNRPAEERLQGVEGALIRSHPVEHEPPNISRDGSYLLYVPRVFPRFFIEMKGSFEDYLKKFSGKTRSTLNRRVRKFAEHSGGKIDFRVYKTAEEAAEFHRVVGPLVKRTYQERLMASGLPDTPEFIAKSKDLAAKDELRAFTIFHGGNAVAYLYCPIQDGRVLLYDFLGYDPEFATWSVGTVLQHLALEELFKEKRFEMFDFTDGAGEHKKFFSTGSAQCVDLWFFRATPKNQLLVRGHQGLIRLNAQIVAAAERTQVKAKLKQFIRARA